MKNSLSSTQQDELFKTLQARFEKHINRHPSLDWTDVRARLETRPQALHALAEMEQTGGEPDVIGYDDKTGKYIFCDCSVESPAGRRSFCYDREGWEARKDAQPENTAVDAAAEMGIQLLTEDEYRALQVLGDFDAKTSSWLMTPNDVRSRGGALFGDRRYGRVFIYHNGAQSYYAARGFRGSLRV